jgi:poly(beta-D-mannuronate) lyase
MKNTILPPPDHAAFFVPLFLLLAFAFAPMKDACAGELKTCAAQDVVANAANSNVERTLASLDSEKRLRLDLQRPVDPRLERLKIGTAAESGLFTGKAHVARTAADVRSLSGKLKPSDQLVLAGGEWKDARFAFSGRGTEAAPILVRPEKPGSVVFGGATEVAFYGCHLIVMGLEFKRVNPATDKAVIFRLGRSEEEPAEHCIVTNLRFEDCGSPSPEDWPRIHLWLMNVRGRDNTVANSVFTGLKNIGQMLGAANLPAEGLQRLHVLNNRFRDRPKIDKQNGYEILQIGWSGEKAKSAGSLIQGNTFENCDGENEIISLKASDIVVRGNQFNGCQGVLSLRAANRVLVQGNLFDGRSKPNTGGITLEGSDHVVIGNIFRNLKKPGSYYFWAIAMLAASAENYGDNGDVAGYGRAKNILIAGNRFEQCDARIAVGAYPRKEYPLLPKNVVVQDNVFTGTDATSAFDYIAPDPASGLLKELHEKDNHFSL